MVEVGMTSRGLPSWQQATASPTKQNNNNNNIPSTSSSHNPRHSDELPLSCTNVNPLTTTSSQSTMVGVFSTANVSATLMLGGDAKGITEPLLSPRTKTQLSIALEGWLKKKGKEGIKLMRRWKSRWFQYQNLKLYYYLSPAG
jgi:hypothetical protein